MSRPSVVAPQPPPHEGRAALPPWTISDGSLEALKWIALIFMVGDHVNKYLLDASVPALYGLGRMVVPIFGFVLMHNLCRPGALTDGGHLRVMKRLTLFGILSTPAFTYLVGWWPLNILFTLLAATMIVYLWERAGHVNRILAFMVFLLGGALVEFWWPALLSCLAAWAFIRQPSVLRLALWIAATASLTLINGNFAALLALPLIWGATQVALPVPRLRWAFYTFYPAHLTALALWLGIH